MQGSTRKSRSGRRLLALVAALAAFTLVLAGSAGAGEQYADPSGDSGSAPDITGATVVSDKSGQLLFHLAVANVPDSGDVQTVLFIDSDANPITGNVGAVGADHLLILDQESHSWGFARWAGSDWNWDAPNLTLKVFRVGDGYLIGINRSDLGNSGRLNFWMVTMAAGGGDGKSDEAPADGAWSFDLQAGGPAIDALTVQAQPTRPKSGKPFTVTVTGLTIANTATKTAPQPDSYTCTATLAGRPLTPGGASKCTFKLSKKARGKTLVVTVTAQYQGVSKSTVLSYKVT